MLNTLKKLIRGILLLTLIIGSIIGFEEVKELSFQHTASKAGPLKIRGNNFCSSSQVKYKGERFTLTNRHCCEVVSNKTKNDRKRRTYFGDNTEGDMIVVGNSLQEIIKLDTKHDLCVLTPDLDKPYLRVANSYSVNEPITIIGHPRGMPQTAREGRIVSVENHIYYWVNPIHKLPMYLLSTIGYGGNSGSPVIDRYGSLVGVVFLGWTQRHTELGAVPLEDVRDFLDRVVAGE